MGMMYISVLKLQTTELNKHVKVTEIKEGCFLCSTEGNVCDNNPCLNGGSCSFIDGTPNLWCECIDGFSGDHCQTGKTGFDLHGNTTTKLFHKF